MTHSNEKTRNDKVIQFPVQKLVFVLKCMHCGGNDFHLMLGTKDPYDIVGYACPHCEIAWKLPERIPMGEKK